MFDNILTIKEYPIYKLKLIQLIFNVTQPKFFLQNPLIYWILILDDIIVKFKSFLKSSKSVFRSCCCSDRHFIIKFSLIILACQNMGQFWLNLFVIYLYCIILLALKVQLWFYIFQITYILFYDIWQLCWWKFLFFFFFMVWWVILRFSFDWCCYVI